MNRSTRAWRLGGVAVAAGSLVAASMAVVPATAAPAGRACENRANLTYANLLECVRVDGVVEHMEAFQAIADANDGNRADQTPGYEASVDYVVDVLEDAGWDADVVPFTYPGVDTLLQQLTPSSVTHETGSFTGSGEGDVTGSVIPVDLSLADPAASTSGCEAADFAGLDLSGPDDIALLQRGACTFGIKATNAQAAGAEGVVIMNTGTPGAEGVLTNVTLGSQFDLPVVGVSFAAGQSLAQPGSTAQISVDFVDRESFNVIGELAGRNDGNVVMAGAHLDSVPAGPGINDNGSGSAALLEIAQQMTRSRPQNTVRFAFWGAEELGLIGSTEWVGQRSQDELDEIALYLNFDMIGSPNYYIGVYDADESSFVAPVPVPEGSEAIEETFESFYTLRVSRTTTRRSAAAATTRRSSTTASPPVACSPAPRSSRRTSRPRSGAAPRVRSSTRATTSSATRSTTTTSTRWRSTPTPSRSRCSGTPPRPSRSTAWTAGRSRGASSSRPRPARSTLSRARSAVTTTTTSTSTRTSSS